MDRRSFFGALLGGVVGAALAPFLATRRSRMADHIKAQLAEIASPYQRMPYEPPQLTYLGRVPVQYVGADLGAGDMSAVTVAEQTPEGKIRIVDSFESSDPDAVFERFQAELNRLCR